MSDPQVPSFQAPPPPPPPSVEAPAPRPVKMRPVAIALFAIGLLVLVGGIAKFIPGGIGAGGAVAFLGILLFALSFIRLPQAVGAEPPMSPIESVLGTFYEPSRVFRNLRAYPRWAAAYIVIVVLVGAYTFAFTRRVTPERIVNYTMDKIAEMGPPFAPPPEMMDTMRADRLEEAKNPIQRVEAVAKTAVGIFVFAALVAAIYFLCILAFGGRINYWQALAIYFYSSLPVIAIQKILSLVILYLKQPEDIHPLLGQESLVQDNLGVLFAPAQHPVLFVLATSIGVLSFYGLWLRAKGLQYGGQRVSSGAAWGSAITIWLLGVILIAIITALFPGFVS
jgi:hypothetical protein